MAEMQRKNFAGESSMGDEVSREKGSRFYGLSAVASRLKRSKFRGKKETVETGDGAGESFSPHSKADSIIGSAGSSEKISLKSGESSGSANVASLSDGLILLANGAVVDLEAAERFRILRAQLERKALGRGPFEVLAITSAVPGEGKSVVAVNLARSFGIDPQGKTLIIDCDLRKPTVHRFFGKKVSTGLSDILISGTAIESVVHSVEPGLDLITAGSTVIDSTRTIEQPGMELLLDELKKRYRRIVLDCPPALLCSEPIALTGLASSALLVVRAWRTQKKLVREAVNVIGRNRIIGLTLNECTDSLQQYGYYSYYGYNKEAVARAKLKRATKGRPNNTKEN